MTAGQQDDRVDVIHEAAKAVIIKLNRTDEYHNLSSKVLPYISGVKPM